jgi:hypothetical protein
MSQVSEALGHGIPRRMASRIMLGTFADDQSFVALRRASKEQLGLSNLVLDELADLADGHSDKLLLPTETRGIGRATFTLLLDGSGTLYGRSCHDHRPGRPAPLAEARCKARART